MHIVATIFPTVWPWYHCSLQIHQEDIFLLDALLLAHYFWRRFRINSVISRLSGLHPFLLCSQKHWIARSYTIRRKDLIFIIQFGAGIYCCDLIWNSLYLMTCEACCNWFNFSRTSKHKRFRAVERKLHFLVFVTYCHT